MLDGKQHLARIDAEIFGKPIKAQRNYLLSRFAEFQDVVTGLQQRLEDLGISLQKD